MNFELKTLDLAQLAREKCDALLVLVDDHFKPGSGVLSELIGQTLKSGDFAAKTGRLLQTYRHPGLAATRLVLVGAGDGSVKQVRSAAAAAVNAIKASRCKQVVLHLGALGNCSDSVVSGAMLAVADATYVYTATKPKAEARSLLAVTLGVADAAANQAGHRNGSGILAGIELAKEWANRPANHATPTHLATVAQALGKPAKFKTEVLGPKEVTRLGMGSFLAVAKGSEEPPRFIVMRYDGAAKTEAPVVLVGKGITFDTGGISIKPAGEMDEMKFDMCGAASVLGVFKALAELRPALNVVGLIPACENMPDGRAIKPGDVVTSMSGQTIEILNTDAEGRLVLCDALTYAERFKPRAVIDIATLTGACVVALGGVRSGLFSANDALAGALQAAGDAALDPCWRLPLDDEYAEGLKTNFADVANIAGRMAGAVTAAKFLQRFTAKFDWAHLDIAGTAWKSGAAKGATGRPVALLVHYLLGQAAATPARAPATRTPRAKTAAPAKSAKPVARARRA
ncbi:MAG: leucyl aminopeptidase [Pseudomonadota bacterium]